MGKFMTDLKYSNQTNHVIIITKKISILYNFSPISFLNLPQLPHAVCSGQMKRADRTALQIL